MLKKLKDTNIFDNEKLYFLPDAIFQIKDFIKKKTNKSIDLPKDKNILGIGMTTTKNFKYLIKEFENSSKNNPDFNLFILGDGEEKIMLKNLINKKIEQQSFFIGKY